MYEQFVLKRDSVQRGVGCRVVEEEEEEKKREDWGRGGLSRQTGEGWTAGLVEGQARRKGRR